MKYLKYRKMEEENIDQYNKELDEAMVRIDNGEYTTQEDLEIEMGSWWVNNLLRARLLGRQGFWKLEDWQIFDDRRGEVQAWWRLF